MEIGLMSFMSAGSSDDSCITYSSMQSVSFDDFNCDLDLFDSSVTPPHKDETSGQSSITVKKPVSAKRACLEIERNVNNSKKPKSRKRTLVEACTRSLPVATKRTGKQAFQLRLFPPPHLDRHDSIVYFPCAMARMINSEDIPAYSQLLQTHCSKQCELLVSRKLKMKLPLAEGIKIFSITTTLQAASVYSMHSTKIVGNQIRAVLYYRYTDIPQMHDYARAFVTDPSLKPLFVTKTRSEMLKKRYPIATLSKADQKAVLALIETDDTIEVHGKLDMVLTFEQITKKITQLEFYTANTSIVHKGSTYKFT